MEKGRPGQDHLLEEAVTATLQGHNDDRGRGRGHREKVTTSR